MIQKQFITYNLNSKGNNPYHILFIEVGMSAIGSATKFTYLMYKKKLHNMESRRPPKITSSFGKNLRRCPKLGWH